MLKKILSDQLTSVANAHGYSISQIIIEIPANTEHGDYATNCSFLLAKALKKNPKLIAEELSEVFNSDSSISSFYAFKPLNGFINISLKDNFLMTQLGQLFCVPFEFPKIPQKILLEYVSANPTGPLHIGHGRWAAIGSVLETLYQFVQADVTTEFYINDAGNQIENLKRTISAIQSGNPIPEDGYHGEYVNDLVTSSEDPVQFLISQHQKVLERFQVTFHNWFKETTLHQNSAVSSTLDQLKKSGYTYEKDNALWFTSTRFGDEKDRVLIKEDGSYTYFAVDIAYHLNKLDRGYNYLINIWGADHHGYVPRMKAALSALSYPNFTTETGFKVIIGQLVSLFRNGEPVRMSKRTGQMISLEEVMDEIGVDATRFFLIHKNSDTHLDFDLDLAKKQSSENPVYYIQYAHARICSILEKVPQAIDLNPESINSILQNDDGFDRYERRLILQILQLPDEIYEAAINCAPYRITHYALELARIFHVFYEHCSILKVQGIVQQKRLMILKNTQMGLQCCLSILRISAPTKM